MIPAPDLLRFGWTFLLLTATSFVATRADEPTPPASPPACPVLVKPGAVPSKLSRPIEPTSFAVDVGTMAPGTRISFDLPIRNTSAAPIRILGGTSGCSLADGCNAIKGSYPLTIPPGATGKIEVEYFAPKTAASTRQARYDALFYVGATTTFAVPYQIAAKVVPESPKVAERE